MVRNNICLNSHPKGCAAAVKEQIAYAKAHIKAEEGCEKPKLALVIGCSTGYGLASRIALGFAYGTATLGLSFEKAGSESKPGTPGFYNNLAFDLEAEKEGIISKTLNGDAFSDELKALTIDEIKKIAEKASLPAKIDLIIYSLASPVRTDPRDKVMYRSVIKPIGTSFSGKTVDMMNGNISVSSAESASEEEIAHTVKVMGGEDWELWIGALEKAGLLSPKVKTIAYTYIGPELSWAIYKNGTIGRAKEDLERAGKAINKKLSPAGGGAWVSVNKALVTRASAVIPIIPFYVSTLFKVMKEKNIHEGCIEQIVRLYRDRLYTKDGKVPTDGEGRIRLDDWEMREDVQKETTERMEKITSENIFELSDVAGFKHDFLAAHGFDIANVDYSADTDPSGI
jgi:enoyl-[acyl-carrier protein] reductase/trans-2-enoyl-CoA reductase (NAD+)